MTTTGAERAAALDAVLPALACPVCLLPLRREGASLVCLDGHTSDVARQGYAALAAGSPMRGDPAPLVAARSAFLAAGHFAAIERAVVAAVPPDAGLLADLAGGPGTYAARVLAARPGLRGIALDASVPAARAAAGASPRLASATCDAWRRLPLQDGSADVVLSVFGPRTGGELARVLAPGGRVIVVTPLPEHLAELRAPFGTLGIGGDKDRRTADRLAPLRLVRSGDVVDRRVLPPEDAARAVLMGPSGHHLDPAAVAATAVALGPIEVTIAVTLSIFRAVPDSRIRIPSADPENLSDTPPARARQAASRPFPPDP